MSTFVKEVQAYRAATACGMRAAMNHVKSERRKRKRNALARGEFNPEHTITDADYRPLP
jgi:hypothetical protein